MRVLFIFMLIGLILSVPALIWVISETNKEIGKNRLLIQSLEVVKLQSDATETVELAADYIQNAEELIETYKCQKAFAVFMLILAIYGVADCIFFNI